LPASANWYCTTVSQCTDNGIYVFGGRNDIYLYRLPQRDDRLGPAQFQWIGIMSLHTGRITCLQLSRNGAQRLCVSGGEDKKIILWDIESRHFIAKHEKHQAKITSLSVSKSTSKWIISGDEKGNIVCWELAAQRFIIGSLRKDSISCIQLSPHDQSDFALGYNDGTIIVANINAESGHISHKLELKGHQRQITCLNWCPVVGDHFETGSNRGNFLYCTLITHYEILYFIHLTVDVLLASASRDRLFRIWNVYKREVITVVKMPNKINGGARNWSKTVDLEKQAKNWISLLWLPWNLNHIVSNYHTGNVLLWDLTHYKKPKHTVFDDQVNHCHTRPVFNISYYSSEQQNYLVTFSLDRQIICWDAIKLQPISVLPTLGGWAHCVRISPLTSSLIAGGLGDNCIITWKVSDKETCYDSRILWQGIDSKVTVINWHPEKEGLLAFGTDKGKVGIYNILSQSSSASWSYHKGTVYSLSWGPQCTFSDKELTSSSTKLMLYSVGGDGIALQHNTQHMESHASNINDIIAKTNDIQQKFPLRSELAWKPDLTLLAIGNDDGLIEIFQAPNLESLLKIQCQSRIVNCLQWHHQHFANDEQLDVTCWLASGSNSMTVYIHDIKQLQLQSSTVVTTSYKQLRGHQHRVTDISWSPHNAYQIATASFDWSIKVWDITSCQIIASYVSHLGRILTVAWSFRDQDLIYSGSQDYSVHFWKVS
ncbi:uncharacterized protein TRIADDRAFT_936, partial [Trichoplax adhaerens]